MKRLALAAVAALALAANACGGVEKDPNLAEAAERTEATGSFAIAITEHETGIRRSSDFECEGAVDTMRSRARVSCTESSGDFEVVVDEESMYVRSSEIAKWSKMPLDEVDAVEQLAPERILGVIRSASERADGADRRGGRPRRADGALRDDRRVRAGGDPRV